MKTDKDFNSRLDREHNSKAQNQFDGITDETSNIYKLVVENAGDGILVAQDGLIKLANPKLCEITGYEENELLESDFRSHVYELDREFVIDRYKRRLSGEDIENEYFFRVIDKNKIIKWIEVKVVLFEWKGDVATLNFVRDISETVRAEQIAMAMFWIAKSVNVTDSLRDLYKDIHHALGRIIDATNFFIAYYNKENGSIEFPYLVDEIDEENVVINIKDKGSLTAEIIRSAKPLFMRGEEIKDFFGSGDKKMWGPMAQCWVGAPLKLKNEVIGAIAVQSYDDPYLYNENDVQLIESLAEQAAIAIGKKNAEEQLRQSEEKFRTAFETSPDAIAISEVSSGKYLDINKGFCRLTKYSKEEIIGKSSKKLEIWVNPEDRGKLLTELNEKGYCDNLEAWFRLKDGSKKLGLLSANVIFINKEPCILTITRDIDDIRKANEKIEKLNFELEQRVVERTSQLQDAMEELKIEVDKRKAIQRDLERYQKELAVALEKEKELNQLKTRFVSMVSHEYRTPLTVIYTSAELLEQYFRSADEEKHEMHLDRIRTSVNGMTSLLEDVLVLGKTESEMMEVKADKFNIVEAVYVQIEELKVLDKGEHEFNFEYSDQDIQVSLDRMMVNHILGNLLANAVKYSEKGTSIEIQIIDYSNWVQIQISDYGIGIPDEDKREVFNHFYRGDNTIKTSGTGLGLSIVKRCVDSLNGSIIFSSELNEGTTFEVNLPKYYDKDSAAD